MVTPGIIIEMKSRYNNMNPAMQQIADYLISHYEEAAYLGIHELAKRSGVSAASVTGFVKEMSYKNYKAFQLAIAVSLGQNNNGQAQAEEGPFVYGGIDEKDSMKEICQKVFRTNMQMLADTLSIIDTREMEAVAEHILKANRVLFLGVGRSFLAAESGKNRFYRLGINTFCYRDPHEQIVGTSMCEKGDMVIAISNYGRSRSVVRATELARSLGVMTVGITSAKNSPLANVVDYPFFSAADTNAMNGPDSAPFEPSSENITQIVMLDCLYMYVALHEKRRIRDKYYATTKELEAERV